MKKFLSLSVTLIMITTLFTGCLLLPENSGTSPETTKPTSVSETTAVSETTEESVSIEEETTVPIETTISTETVSETEIPVTEETPSETTLPEESENSVSTSKTTIAKPYNLYRFTAFAILAVMFGKIPKAVLWV